MMSDQTKPLSAIHTDDQQREVDALRRRGSDSITRRVHRAALEEIRESVVAGLSKIHRKKPSTKDAKTAAAALLAPLLGRAASLGEINAGVQGWKRTRSASIMLANLIDAEATFFSAFAGEGMKASQRLSMYGGASDAAFWLAWVSTLPANAEIVWVLGIAEHCQGCLALARANPFSPPGRGRNPLPTVPRNGYTPCLTNCRCSLRLVRPVRTGLVSTIGVEIFAIGALTIDPMSDVALAEAAGYQSLADLHAYFVRMAEVTGQEAWREAAKDAKAKIDAVASTLRHSVRLSSTTAELLEPIIEARRRGFRFVEPSSIQDDLVGAVVVVLVGDTVDRDEVTGVSGSRVRLGEGAGREYDIGYPGLGMLFVVEEA